MSDIEYCNFPILDYISLKVFRQQLIYEVWRNSPKEKRVMELSTNFIDSVIITFDKIIECVRFTFAPWNSKYITFILKYSSTNCLFQSL